MATKVMLCTCNNLFQDRPYGAGRRVHNSMSKDRKLSGWKCTVCGSKKSISKGEEEPVAVKGAK